MQSFAIVVERAVGFLVHAAAYIAGAVLVALMLLTAADVAGRAIFNTPITGVFDLTHFAVLTMVYLGLALCGFRGDHIAIEIVYQKLGHRTRRVLDGLTNLIGAALFGLIAWQAMAQAVIVREINEASQLLNVPFFPFYWLLAAGSALFALVMVVRIVVPAPSAGKSMPETGGETRSEPAP